MSGRRRRRGRVGEWEREEERGKSTQSDDSTHLSVETNRELVSGVCRLSELLVSPGYKEEEEGGREREGGTLPPPVAIHYNCREWTGERHQDVTRDKGIRDKKFS